MNKKNVMQYLAAVFACFILGCGVTLILRQVDLSDENILPLTEGTTASFPLSGFTLLLPDEAQVLYTSDNTSTALEHATLVIGDSLIRFASFSNTTRDRIDALDPQTLITEYTHAGAEDARLRTLGGRRFIQYAVTLTGEDGVSHRYLTFETWDEDNHLIFETEMNARDVLPLLASIAF